MHGHTSVVEDITMVKTATGKELGNPEDWPLADTPPEAEQKGLRDDDAEQRESGDEGDSKETADS